MDKIDGFIAIYKNSDTDAAEWYPAGVLPQLEDRLDGLTEEHINEAGDRLLAAAMDPSATRFAARTFYEAALKSYECVYNSENEVSASKDKLRHMGTTLIDCALARDEQREPHRFMKFVKDETAPIEILPALAALRLSMDYDRDNEYLAGISEKLADRGYEAAAIAIRDFNKHDPSTEK